MLSQRYIDVLIGRNGSKSTVTFFSLPSSVMMSPQYMMRPLGGVRVYIFSRCCVEVMAPSTDKRFTRDLIHEAVPYSSVSILLILLISSLGGMMSEIIDVPAPFAPSSCLISLRTFHCSIAESKFSSAAADLTFP